jgi:hypothetical protein
MGSNKLKIKLYRHIYHKDIFLSRNWNYCGGDEDTPFYYATRNMRTALVDANEPDFLIWTHRFLDFEGKTKLKAKMTDTKEVDIDGYVGTLKKELVLPVSEFALVELAEV